MTNRVKLRLLLLDVFLLEPDEFHWDLLRKDVETWDSLGLLSMAVGVQESFGYHFSADEANSIKSVQDIIKILSVNGISFEE